MGQWKWVVQFWKVGTRVFVSHGGLQHRREPLLIPTLSMGDPTNDSVPLKLLPRDAAPIKENLDLFVSIPGELDATLLMTEEAPNMESIQ
jgi:hypothetical protein